MASLGNGGRTGNGRSSGLCQKSSPALKRAQLSVTQERAVHRELEILFPRIPSILIGEFSRVFGSDFIRALNSVDSTSGLKKYIHDHCREWLSQHTENFTGHVPASWGRIDLVQTGKFTRAPKKILKPTKK